MHLGRCHLPLLLTIGMLGISSLTLAWWIFFSFTQTHTVTITEDGYFPKQLSIAAGDRVTWQNRGTSPHWPASNVHPTHGRYPAHSSSTCLGSDFDACRGIPPNESFTFRFQEVGRWGYHDHLRPALIGTVRVYPSSLTGYVQYVHDVTHAGISQMQMYVVGSRPDMPNAASFRNMSFQEQIERFQTYSRAQPQDAWHYLKDTFVKNGKVIGNAHELAHIAGNNLYRRNGLSGIRVCDQMFAFGCMHGVTEQMLITEGPSVVSNLSEQCRSIYQENDRHQRGYTGCIHGTGHGLLSWNNLDVSQALQHCNKLPEQDRNYCYDGVFMEHAFSRQDSTFQEDDPWRLCRNLPQQYQYNCARYQTNIFRSADRSFSESARLCTEAPDEDMRHACTNSMGFFAAQMGSQENDRVAAIRTQCQTFNTAALRHRCVRAAAGELIFQEFLNADTDARALCNSLPRAAATRCQSRIERIAERNENGT